MHQLKKHLSDLTDSGNLEILQLQPWKFVEACYQCNITQMLN